VGSSPAPVDFSAHPALRSAATDLFALQVYLSAMIPRQPSRNPQVGFIYVPPFRIQGISIAGEQSVVQIPELDLCFDLGVCPRTMLSSNYVALTHGHMDHSAGLAYYFSQRNFQGMEGGTVICHRQLEQPIHNIMKAWVQLEAQKTPFKTIALEHEGQVEIKNNYFLRAFATNHTVPSLGYVVVEKRSKLKEEFSNLPQEKLIELKKKGKQITHTLEIPLVCYTGDTMWGDHFDRPDVLNSKILITECTFIEPDHRQRAGVGKHLHLDNIVELLGKCSSEAVILTHLSRRTHIAAVRKALDEAISPADQERVLILMDTRANRQRYDRQMAELETSQ
jgi:ribonuclease Z